MRSYALAPARCELHKLECSQLDAFHLCVRVTCAIRKVTSACQYQWYHCALLRTRPACLSAQHDAFRVTHYNRRCRFRYGRENHTDFWLIKNSWGREWGDEGYLKLERTDSTQSAGKCGLAMVPSFPIKSHANPPRPPKPGAHLAAPPEPAFATCMALRMHAAPSLPSSWCR